MTKSQKEITNANVKKKSTIIFFGVLLVFMCLFSFSSYKIISWYIDNNKTQDVINELENEIEIIERDGPNTVIIDTDSKEKYLAMKLIDVDLSAVKKKNKETMGWIKVEGTKVNYPFVQTKDNEYYLNHSLDQSINEAGWIFLDYRNKLGEDKNTVLYGHGRINKTMFGSLNDILDNNWTKDDNNFVIRVSSEKENTLWQIFSVYHINTTDDYITVNFKNNSEFIKFTNMLIDRSMYDFKTKVNEDDVIITLSTCYNNDEKMVVHAKLIKKESK